MVIPAWIKQLSVGVILFSFGGFVLVDMSSDIMGFYQRHGAVVTSISVGFLVVISTSSMMVGILSVSSGIFSRFKDVDLTWLDRQMGRVENVYDSVADWMSRDGVK